MKKERLERIKLPDKKIFLVFLLLAMIASYLIFYSTTWGPWAFSDSTAYIDSARNLIKGIGFGHLTASGRFEYVGGHPPLYQLTLAIAGFLGFNMIDAARWINLVMFGLLILILGISIYKISRSIWLSTIICLIILTSPVLLDNFSGLMSEPLFIFFGTTGLILMILYLQERKISYLIAAAISSGLAFLTRYPGIAYIITGMIFLITVDKVKWKQRFLNLTYYLVLSCIPMLLWFTWMYTRPEPVSPRQVTPVIQNIWTSIGSLRVDMVNVFWGWLPYSTYLQDVPYRIKLGFFILMGLCMVLMLLISIHKAKKDECSWISNPFLLVTAISLFFLISYLAILIVSYTISFAKPDINNRMLSPTQPFFFSLAFSFLFFLEYVWKRQNLIRSLSLILSILIISSYAFQSIDILS